MATNQYYFTLKGSWRRFLREMRYSNTPTWTLIEVGKFWDTVKDYDDINEELYTYDRRFSNSFKLAEKYLPRHDYTLLDIQSRSGKGSIYWQQKGKLKRAVCVDFSDYLSSLAKRRLMNSGLDFQSLKIDRFPLVFADGCFNFICSYETVEHVCDYGDMISELTRVLTNEGIMIVTCPNRSWEWVHCLSVVININHSEGPHRFLKRKELLDCFRQNGLKVLEENTTILLPFNHPWSFAVNNFLERNLSERIKRYLALRRTFILKKTLPVKTL